MTRHGSYPADVVPPRSKYYDAGRFGRMFGELPPFAADTPEVRAALLDIGKAGGIMDAGDDLSAGPVQLIVDPALSHQNRNSTTHVAGDTFLGQFIDHDITFDPTSSLERQVDPEFISNFRTPGLGLDNVYGSGPNASPYLYDQKAGHGITMLVEECGTPGRSDLPRNAQGVALIGDPRNDENLIVSQLQTAMLRFHNAAVEHVKTKLGLTSPGEVFAEAQRLVRWHYQWIVVHHFTRTLCGSAVVDDILQKGRKHYQWHNEPFIPVEFSVAAYRFGHSQIRPSYRANFTGNADGGPFFGMIFTPEGTPAGDPDDLSGGCRAPRRFVDWPTFFDFGDGSVRPNKKIDTTLSTALFALPGSVVARPDAAANPASLAQRNLLRHLTFSLPSGQRVARAMNLPELARHDLDDLQQYGMDDRTPLWFYILREADVVEDGDRLGPVGARIVAEVLIGLLQGDRSSYLAQDPDWQPSLPTLDPARQGDDFRMVDLLHFAGVA
ncbi:heme peroxidase family protein [Microbacterium sp. M3]|uniref:Heme peroxidase family protein n=1 Tax=Microbacterium arthrosphaerae TaxID=792652 RepID=A0ABU4H3M4_9MICO|nr:MULTISPECIES: heme peroxidase family protein [Microbacterium]MDW4573940.1 heme peroxidase family protein [Microbacterium arthrosphaerae]MDW7607795.1 heme peroxidase family protein [Microbacterium sp. M3]